MDNHHVRINSSSASCGVLELSDFKSDVDKVLYALATHLYHPSRGTPAAFALWSDVAIDGVNSNGTALSYRIDDLKLGGHVLTTPKVENPKTTNPIRVYVWEIPHEAFKKWYVEERVRRAKKL